MTRLFCIRWCALLLLLPGCEQPPVRDAEADDAPPEWTDTHQLAWDVVSSQPLVTLITLDEDGHPQARIVESLPPDSGRMDIWIGTNRNSAKVREIRNDDRATLFYRMPRGAGYVTLRGRATIVDDPREKEARWRPHWEPLYLDPETMYVLIHFQPEDGEVLDLSSGLVGDSLTWAAPEFRF